MERQVYWNAGENNFRTVYISEYKAGRDGAGYCHGADLLSAS